MSTERPVTDFYVTGGTMSPDAGSYVERAADEELFVALKRGEYCYVLTTRQMGKSSLMARTARRLAAHRIRSAQVTLETIRESVTAPSPDEFLYSIANRIHRDLGLTTRLSDWWRERGLLSATQRFHEYVTELLLEGCDSPIVVFIDEIDSTIGLPFADDFFATIRACYNERASRPELKRLTFVLLGVATPAQLITDPARTPFNIGRGINLGDFTLEQAEPLTRGFPGSDAERHAFLGRVLSWTGGHPYLTQTVCRALAARAGEGSSPSAPEDGADAEVERLFLRPEAAREEANLKFVRSRLTQGTPNLRAVLRTYQKVLEGKLVEDQPASSIHASLKLAGVVRVDADGRLRPRNRIYEQVFGPGWVKRELPRERARIVALAAVALLLIGGGASVYVYRLQQAELAQQTAQLRETEARLSVANLARLSSLARQNPYVWAPGSQLVNDAFRREITPAMFSSAPWLTADVQPSQLIDTIERGHLVFISSVELFGAMSFALEEVYARNETDSQLAARVRSVFEEVRGAFIAYHKEHTNGFQAPPRQVLRDSLNTWVPLPPGEFVMGSAVGPFDDERPTRTIRLSGFSMQQHEVTNEEYRRFDPTHEFPAAKERHPVANVSWYEAAAYAAWLGASLPTEAQWEYAGRGTGPTGGRVYPWGNEPPDQTRAVYGTGHTAPVGSRPAGRTPEGLDDMAGNVWEWCRDVYGVYERGDHREPLGPVAGSGEGGNIVVRVLRGGSFGFAESSLRAAYRLRYTPVDRNDRIGFRLVSSRLRP